MSDANSQRNVPKRQIARLIGSATFPMWVLSEESQIVFANESFAATFPQLGPDPLGLVCTVDAQEPEAQQTLLARWLALPANGSSQWVRCIRDRFPAELSIAESAGWIDQPLVRWILPLDDSQTPCYLCVIKPDRGDSQSILEGDFHQRIEVPALSILVHDANLEGLWYLQGLSLVSQTMRSQLQLAISGTHPLCLHGIPGNYLVQLASLIFKERCIRRGAAPSPIPPFTIDCSLMDKDLLQSTLEWIDDARRRNPSPEVIVHRLDLLASDLRDPLARICRQQRWEFITTCNIENSESAVAGGEDWQWLLWSMRIQEIRIAPLKSRIEEIESLLAAWMRSNPNLRWTPSFLDTLLAYSWPGDVDEMHQALAMAVQASCQQSSGLSTSGQLDESHLPISLRTFPSHIERPAEQEPIELDQVLERLERLLIEGALASHPRNNTAAAKSLGISRARLLRRMQQWGLGAERPTSTQPDEVIFEELDQPESFGVDGSSI